MTASLRYAGLLTLGVCARRRSTRRRQRTFMGALGTAMPPGCSGVAASYY
jgi:hypothetical protein